MAKIISIGKPENQGESRTFQYLETQLPDTALVLTNVAVPDSRGNRDADAIAFSQTGVHLIEIKDWAGTLRGTQVGDWHQDEATVKNPCFQITQTREIFRNFVFRNAKKIFDDPRSSYGVPVEALLVFVHATATTDGVKIQALEHLHVCKKLDDLASAMTRQRMRTRQFLRIAEIRKITELLGARKSDLDAWEQNLTPKTCGKCSHENRPSAKFCLQCGAKFA